MTADTTPESDNSNHVGRLRRRPASVKERAPKERQQRAHDVAPWEVSTVEGWTRRAASVQWQPSLKVEEPAWKHALLPSVGRLASPALPVQHSSR